MLVRESIYESIKHLTPRSEEELKTNVKGLDLYQKIILGAKEGFLWAVKDAIREGADDYYKNEALLWAAFRGYDEIIKLLLNSGADIHYQKEHALYWAVRCEHAETIKLLLEKGAIITPTILDVAYHVNDEIKNLVQQEYDKSKHKKVNESIKHLTPRSEQELQTTMKNLSPKEKLDTGAEQGIIWLVKDAIAAGADVHARNDYALQNASYYGHAEMVKLLLNAGANVHADNDLALQWASYKGHAEVVQLLLDAGTDMHAMDDYALRWASYKGHTKVVKLLKQYRAKHKRVNESIKHLSGRSSGELKSYLKDLTPLEQFEEGCTNGILWAVKEAVKNYPDMHSAAPETYGHGFANAAWNNHLDVIKFLAKKPVLDDFYRTYAICAAVANGYLDILKYLIEELKYDPALATSKKVVFSIDNNHDYSPIWTAANDGYIDIIKYLISFKSVRKAINEYEAEQISVKTGIPFKDIIKA